MEEIKNNPEVLQSLLITLKFLDLVKMSATEEDQKDINKVFEILKKKFNEIIIK